MTSLKFSTATIDKALRENAMKNVKDEEMIKKAVKEFTTEHYSHGFPITYTKLQEYNIGEKVSDEQLRSIKTLMGVYQQFMANSNIVKLIGNREENKNIAVTPLTPVQQVPTRTAL